MRVWPSDATIVTQTLHIMERWTTKAFFLRSLFQLPYFGSKETLTKQDMAERCLIDYCGAADKKDCCMFHIQTMKLSFAASFTDVVLSNCRKMPGRLYHWLYLGRKKIQNTLFIEATQISTEFLSAKDNISRDLSK